MLLIEPGKPRVRHFIMGHMRNPGSPLSRKLQSCPALACIAGNIPPKKLKGWNFSDEFYHARFKEIRLCLHGLIGHGACLAAHGSGEQLPALRDFICGLAAFWPDPFEEDDDPVVREEHYGALFDDAVSAAQNGVDAPELSEGRKENIIIGLENYIIDLAGQFSKINQEALDSGLGACESIAAGFQEMWTDPVHTRRVETIQTPSQVLT
ncbi:hypothetical protein N510_003490 [Firmicutes bacterium ASF500]|nr:hypothetical protein N510_003490 [Firmicutes bacterium ASF500]